MNCNMNYMGNGYTLKCVGTGRSSYEVSKNEPKLQKTTTIEIDQGDDLKKVQVGARVLTTDIPDESGVITQTEKEGLAIIREAFSKETDEYMKRQIKVFYNNALKEASLGYMNADTSDIPKL